MKEFGKSRIIYMPEGDIDDEFNYSGTPRYINSVLSEYCANNSIEYIMLSTKELINMEDLWKYWYIIKKEKYQLNDLVNDNLLNLKQYRLEFKLNIALLERLCLAETQDEALGAVVKYDIEVSDYLNAKFKNIIKQNDNILFLNPFNPSFDNTYNCYYYLDVSLFAFYFNRKFSFLKFINSNKVKEYYKQLENKRLSNAKKVFCFSNACADEIKKLYSLKNTLCVYAGINFVKSEMKSRCIRKKSSEVSFLFVGRDFEAKGGKELIEAFEEFQKDKKVKLSIITEKQYIKKSKSEKILFYPLVDKKTLHNFYLNHDVFVFPSKIDAFGLVCCEAMFHKMIVIGSDFFAIPEIIGKENKELIFQTDSRQSILNCLEYIYYNIHKLEEIKINNYNKVLELYNWKKVSELIVNNIIKN